MGYLPVGGPILTSVGAGSTSRCAEETTVDFAFEARCLDLGSSSRSDSEESLSFDLGLLVGSVTRPFDLPVGTCFFGLALSSELLDSTSSLCFLAFFARWRFVPPDLVVSFEFFLGGFEGVFPYGRLSAIHAVCRVSREDELEHS